MTPGSSAIFGGVSIVHRHVLICLNCDLCDYVAVTVGDAAV